MRIDEFIKRQLSKAASADASGITDSANRAAALGFANAANSRYAAFLEAFQSSPRLTAEYQESYPSSLFLPWPAFHAVIKALDLWVDLPLNYMGAVPPEQLPWLEVFELQPNDRIRPIRQDLEGLLPSCDGRRIENLLRQDTYSDRFSHDSHIANKLRAYWHDAESSFFVVAPPQAFRTQEDWLTRFRKLAEQAPVSQTIPPDDPLVIRFCFGGCLVVAAWGDEAAALNEITRSLGI